MKRRIQWMAAVFLAGSTAMAIGGPNIGPYGPWNSGGAYGGFGPYDPYVARGYRVQEGLPAVAEVVSNDCVIPSRRVVVSESLPVVAERVSTSADVVMTDQVVPITSRAECLGGQEFVTTTSRIRPVRTIVTNGDLAPVGERVVTFRPAARERLLPVGERIVRSRSYRDNCELLPVRERLLPVRERLLPVRERLLPVRERIISRSSSFRPFRDDCELAPVAERRLLPVRQRLIRPLRYDNGWGPFAGRRAFRSYHYDNGLAPIAERRAFRTYRNDWDLAPIAERRAFRTFRNDCDLAPIAERRGFRPFAFRGRQPIVINTEVITTTTRWNTGTKKHATRSSKKLAPVAEKTQCPKTHRTYTKTSKKRIMPVGERVIVHKKSMIKKHQRPLYPSASNDYINPYR